MTPRHLLSKVLATVTNNTLLPMRLNLDTMLEEVYDYVTTLKSGQEEFNTLVGLIRQINSVGFKYSKQKLLADVSTEFPDDPDWESYINNTVLDTTDEVELSKSVLSDTQDIRRMLVIPRVSDVLSKSGFELKYNQSKVKDVNAYVSGIITKLETLISGTGKTDAAITADIDFSSKEQLEMVFDDVVELNNGGASYTLGWQALNKALQGGPKPGDLFMVGALEHNYKSSLVRSITRQIATYNKPPEYDATNTKKPLIAFFSFEDSEKLILQFMFQDIMYNETRQPVNIKDFTSKQMADKVYSTYNNNGWEFRLKRVNPTDWTYRALLEQVMTFEGQGYDVKVVAADYLLQIPTTGCNQSGAQGTDLRDLVRRVRNYMSTKNILFITPGQLSTQVKDLLINGTPDRNILSIIAERGMYAGSKQISHDLDISMLIKKVRVGEMTYLDFLVEKHRAPQAIDDKYKHFCLPMSPNGMPIVDDLNSEKPIHFYTMPSEY